MANSHSWTKTQIKNHTEAAKKLSLIKDDVFSYIKNNKNIFEEDVRKFILKQYKEYGLVNDDKKEFAIVAFGKNTKEVHYFPSPTSNSKLKTNNLILLDIWARLNKQNAPYADMTWMFYKKPKVESGKLVVDKNFKTIEKKWKVLVKARDAALQILEENLECGILPRGLDLDRASHDIIGASESGEVIKHTVGHSLGFNHPHGNLPGISWRTYKRLEKNIGYTIEPGIYLKDFGMRTEIDFYISNQNKIIITTPIQEKITII